MIVKDVLVKENNVFFVQKDHKTSFQQRPEGWRVYILRTVFVYSVKDVCQTLQESSRIFLF